MLENDIQQWISVYTASIALECTPDEILQRISKGDIQAIQATKKRRAYWKVVDAKAIEAFKEINMEIMYPYLRTERYKRYCDRWVNDDIAACEKRYEAARGVNNA